MVDETSTLERMARVETKVDFIIARLDTLPPSPVCVLRHQEIEAMVHDVSERVANIESLRNKVIGAGLVLNVALIVFMDKIKKFFGVVPILALFLVLLTSYAFAHSWYSEKRDPVTHHGCCGGTDCATLLIEPGVLTPESDGYRIRLTVEQARRINPARLEPVDAFIPRARIQPSENGNFHLCLPRFNGVTMGDFYCFFEPPST